MGRIFDWVSLGDELFLATDGDKVFVKKSTSATQQL
jgi:hypothetical protein